MSTFLGPIHHWLFNKIRYVEDRENAIIEAFSERYGDKVMDIVRTARDKYGMPFDNTDLGELIGDAPIHFWLQDAIRKVETREAAILKGLIDRYGDDAEELARKVAFDHGVKVGTDALEGGHDKGGGIEAVYNLIHNHFLDGMPCDHVTEVENRDPDLLIERHTDCLHRDYWDEAGLSHRFMCGFLESWVSGLCSVDPRIEFDRVRSIVRGDKNCEDVFKLKAS